MLTITLGQAKVGKLIGVAVPTAGAVETTMIAVDAIESSLIAADEILTTHILAGEIESSLIAPDEILTTHIKAGEIETTLIKPGEILTTLITAGEIESTLRRKAVTAVGLVGPVGTLPVKQGTYHITCAGTTNVVVVGASTAVLETPVAGDWYDFAVDIAANSSVRKVMVTTAGEATFDGTNDVLVFSGGSTKGITRYSASIQALSAARWIVTAFSTGVTLAATT